jgi:hypothetical protein
MLGDALISGSPSDRIIQGRGPEVDWAQAQGFSGPGDPYFLDGSVGKAESVFGWSYHTVAPAWNELRTGVACIGYFSAQGHHKTHDDLERASPHRQLVAVIRFGRIVCEKLMPF